MQNHQTRRRILGVTRLRLRELRDQVEQALSRELGRPLYVVFSCEVPAELRPSGVRACTGRWLGSILKPHLGHRWRGFGPSMILDEQDLTRCVREWSRVRPGLRRRTMAALEFLESVAHEISHIVQFHWDIEPEASPEWTAAATTMTAASYTVAPAPLKDEPIPWDRHGGDFLRLLFHVSERLQTAVGIRFSPSLDTQAYGLSSRWRWQSALGNEPERLAHLPLTAIGDIPPPDAFAQLWRDNLRKWWMALDPSTEFQTVAFFGGLKLFPPSDKEFSIMELLERITSTFKNLRRQQADGYNRLVADLAQGEQVDPARAAEILADADKTPEDLTADVALHQRRLELRATIDAVPGLDAEEKKLRKVIDEANRAWKKANEKYDAAIHPPAFRLEQIAAARTVANRARAELLKTSSSELLEQRRELEDEIGAVSTESTSKKNAARDARENIRKLGLTPPAQESFDPWDKRGRREVAEVAQQIEAEQARLGELESEVAKLEEQRSELDTRRKALEAQQLEA